MGIGMSIIGAGFDVFEWSFPDWAWVLVALSGVFVAQFLAFHAMRIQRDEMKIKVTQARGDRDGLKEQLEQEGQSPSNRHSYARRLLRKLAHDGSQLLVHPVFRDTAKFVVDFRDWRTKAGNAVKAIKGPAEERRFLDCVTGPPENNPFIARPDANAERKQIEQTLPSYVQFLLDLSSSIQETEVEPTLRVAD